MYSAAKVSAQLVETSEFYLNPKATETADLLLFFDRVFDSVNDTLRYPLPGKDLRCVVTHLIWVSGNLVWLSFPQ